MKTNDLLIKQQLMKWTMELKAAARILKGNDLEEFKSLIAEIANLCGLKTTDTGTFIKPEFDDG